MYGLRLVLSLCILSGIHSAAAQSNDADDQREGPYRSRMRIIDERAPAITTQAPADLEFANALNARARGYLAAREGNTDEAITQLRTALDSGVLAPIAVSDLVQDLLALLSQSGRDRELVTLYQQQRTQAAGISPQVKMAVAQSAVALGQFELALAATDSALGPDAPRSWRRYKVYLLSQLQRYDEAATLAAQILPLNEKNPALWRQLIELQRAAEQPRLAVASAELALDQGVLTTTEDVLQLARLYLATGLPDHADVALTRHHETSAPNVSTLAMLLRAQRNAGSLRSALATARQLSTVGATPDHLLVQAQLEHELQEPAAVVDTLRRALRKDLGRQRGQALLLLGENLVATDALGAARRAFKEASEIGGVYRDAQRWLARLDALKAANASSAADALGEDNAVPATPSSSPDTEVIAANATELDIRRLPPLQFFHASAEATLESLADVAAKLQRRVGIGLRRERLSAAGPLRWRIDGRVLVEGGSSPLQLGVPVRTRLPPRGRFKNIDLPPLTAAVRDYAGDVNGLGEAWRQLTADVVAAGRTPGSDARTVVMEVPDASGKGGRFELQLEIMESR